MKIRPSKVLTSLAGIAAVGAIAVLTYPDSAPADPPAKPSAADLQSAVRVAALIDEATPVDTVPSISGYERSCGRGKACSFGTAWTDDYVGPAGRNGCDTRNDALSAQLSATEFKPGTRGCVVLSGTLHDPYTGTMILFTKQDPSKVHLDHIYPLRRAWDMGAAQWPMDKKIQFANDLERNLLAVDGESNQQKSAKGLDGWMPTNAAFGCDYAARYLTVARDYGLSVTHGDIQSAERACTLDPEMSQEK